MKHNRNFATLLLLAMLAATACGGTESVPEDSTTISDNTITTSQETEFVNWESSGLPKKDYDGREFMILSDAVSNMTHA